MKHIALGANLNDTRPGFLANVDDACVVNPHFWMKAEIVTVRVHIFREKGRNHDFAGGDSVHDFRSGEYHLSSNPIREGTTVLEFRYLPLYATWLPLFRQKQTLPIDIPL